MIRALLHGLNMKSASHRQRSSGWRGRRLWRLEGLEDRVLLANNPTIYMVDSTGDTGMGSGNAGDLLYVINQANANPNPAGSLIEFSTPLFSTPQSITLTNTLELSGSGGPITIAGPGANLLTVSGNNTVGVFTIDVGVTAFLSGLSISSGRANDGAGIDNEGTVSLLNSTITNNVANSGGEGGGIDNDGMLAISGCTITNNSISGTGGDGGGIASDGTLSVSNSTIAGNSVSSAGLGGGVFNSSTATLTDSTVASNSVGSGGDGGGLYNDGPMMVSGSTIATNSAGGDGGGIYNEDILTLPNSTVAGNSAGNEGGGIFNDETLTAVNTTIGYNIVAIGGTGGGLDAAAGKSTLNNTIVALNVRLVGSSSAPDDVAGTLSTSSTFNLIGAGGGGGLTNGINGNQVGVASPGLGPLTNNGGPTQTIALLPGSPAVDAGSNALDGLAFDQRGLARVFNGTIDIGAFELQPALVTTVSVQWGIAGTATLQTASDGLRLLPAGRNNDIPWYNINRLQITFNQPETLTSAEITVTGARGTNYGPVTIAGSGELYAITLGLPISKPNRVTITIAGAGIATYTRRLDVLAGDVNDDGVVNKSDAKIVLNQARGLSPASIFGDVLGDGKVDGNDYNAVRKLEGKQYSRLPKVRSAALQRSLAREHLDMKHELH